MFSCDKLHAEGASHGAVPPVHRSKLSLKWRRQKAALLSKNDEPVSFPNKVQVTSIINIAADEGAQELNNLVPDATLENHNNLSSNDLYNLMQTNEWFSVLTAIEVSPDLATTWITKVECDGKVVDCSFLPLHAAVTLKAPALIVSALLSIHPKSALSRNDKGLVPLHLAVLHESTEKVFFELFSACPEAIEATDNNGNTPMHYHLESCSKLKNRKLSDADERTSLHGDGPSTTKRKKPAVDHAAWSTEIEVVKQLIVEFPCRCSCERKFVSLDDRRNHERICWLKLPYGSIWSCEKCSIKFPTYSYESILRHEQTCYFNAPVMPGSAIHMFTSCTRSSGEGDAPICDCTHLATYCIVSRSRSEKNPDRKYFRCSKDNVDDRCRFFKWLKDS